MTGTTVPYFQMHQKTDEKIIAPPFFFFFSMASLGIEPIESWSSLLIQPMW